MSFYTFFPQAALNCIGENNNQERGGNYTHTRLCRSEVKQIWSGYFEVANGFCIATIMHMSVDLSTFFECLEMV